MRSDVSCPVEPGQVLKGKYVIDRVLGAGGMGVVVAARHVALEQRFAIKFLLPAMLAHREIVDRFAREARALSRLEGDHVARVFDVDTLEDGTPFMVMEFLDGHDLSVVRRERRPLPVHVAVAFILEACEALAEAHAVGIVHRDLKPANLFLARRRDGKTRVKVLDFGISKVSDPSGSENVSTTSTSAVMGSAEFMSPEQMLSTREVDARTDIWALGVTLFELLTATAPFPGDTITQVCALVMTTAPPLPSSLRPDVPPGLDAVVLRCLEKDRAARYPAVRELMAALSDFTSTDSGAFPAPQSGDAQQGADPNMDQTYPLDALAQAVRQSAPSVRAHSARDAGITPPSVPTGPGPLSVHTVTPVSTTASDPKPTRSSRGPILVGFAVAVLGLLVAAFVVTTRAPTPAAASPVAAAPSAAALPSAPPSATPNVTAASTGAPPPTMEVTASPAPLVAPGTAAPAPRRAGPRPSASAAPSARAAEKKDMYGDR
jgi:serine/threonine-protein kinase